MSWIGADGDGDSLVYKVEYSNDNGSTWHVLAVNVQMPTSHLEPDGDVAQDQPVGRLMDDGRPDAGAARHAGQEQPLPLTDQGHQQERKDDPACPEFQ